MYCICPDKRTAESIEILELNKEERNRYFNSKASKTKEEKMQKDDEGENNEEEDDATGYQQIQC